MKLLITISVLFSCLISNASPGDIYATPGKLGRVSPSQGIFEIVGLMVAVDHDGVMMTPKIKVKAAVDMVEDVYGNDISISAEKVVEGARAGAFSIGMIYRDEVDTFVPTTNCLGKDFQYLNPKFGSDPDEPYKICVTVKAKTLFIK